MNAFKRYLTISDLGISVGQEQLCRHRCILQVRVGVCARVSLLLEENLEDNSAAFFKGNTDINDSRVQKVGL